MKIKIPVPYTNILQGRNVLVLHAESIQDFVIGLEINEEYYNGILKRLDTFISADKNKTSEIEVIVDGESTNCQVNDKETDKELNEKTILFNNLLEQLNDYFNEQSLSILKTLTLTFKTDANEKRVRQVLEERKKI